MEAIGLAVGVASLVGLFSSCLEAVDRVETYRSFGNDAHVLDTRFRAAKARLERWGRQVGLEEDRSSKDWHPAIGERDISVAVEDVLRIINTICDSGNVPSEGRPGFALRRVDSALLGPRQQLYSVRRQKLSWALWGKGKRTDQVELLENLVQQLHNLVPLDASDTPVSRPGTLPRHAVAAELQRILARIEEVNTVETRREVYSWLGRSSPNERYHDSIQKKLDGTCDWILDRPAFQTWLSPEFPQGAKILWINGPAGFGKTVLCARSVEYLLSSLDTPVAHFFFSSELENRDDPFQAIRSWIFQVVSQHEEAFEQARFVWEQDSDLVCTRMTAVSLFEELLHLVPNCTFIADGLDECTHLADSDVSVARFLRTVMDAVDGSDHRILLVSRDEPQIRHAIIDNALSGFAEYRISPDDVRSDTAVLSRAIVDRKLSNKSDKVRSTLSEAMTDRCEGQFLWLKMQEESLRRGLNVKQLRHVVEQTPAGLDGLYGRNWTRITSSRDRERIFSLLRWAAFALRPLTVCEITEAVLIDDSDDLPMDDLPDSVDDDYVDSEIVGLCGPLLEVRGQHLDSSKGQGFDNSAGQQTVHLAHFSVRQFLLCNLPAPSWIQENERLRAEYQNGLLAKACIHYINFRRVWKDCPPDHMSHLGMTFRDYAAGSWHHHFKSRLRKDGETSQLAIRFLDRSNPSWNAWRAWSDNQDPDLQAPEAESASASLPGPLHYAVKLELADMTEALTKEQGCDVNEVSACGLSALEVACVKGNAQVLRILLDADADVSAPRRNWVSPLISASLYGHVEVVKLLLDNGASASIAIQDGWTPLHLASYHGHIEAATLLIERGSASATAVNDQQVTPLHMAQHEGHAEMIRVLTEKGASVTARDSNGWTPLQYATWDGRVEAAKLLIEKGSSVATHSDKYGSTLLHTTALRGHIDMAKLLIQNGAAGAVNAPDLTGWTPLHHAASEGHADLARLLVQNGASTTATLRDGRMPLHIASAMGRPEIVQSLLPPTLTGVSQTDRCGRTALFYASRYGSVSVAQALLSHGKIDPGVRDWHGSTALFAAVRNGHLDVAELLLRTRGTETQGRDGFGRSVFWWAQRSGNSRLLWLLEQHAERAGNRVPDDDSPAHVTPVRFDPDTSFCDACTMSIPRGQEYKCRACKDQFDFCLCLNCFLGVDFQCRRDGTHVPVPPSRDNSTRVKGGDSSPSGVDIDTSWPLQRGQ